MKFKISPTPNPQDPDRPMKTPEMEVQLLGDNGAMMDISLALIDSGANDTMVSSDYAVELGIDLSVVEEFDISGIGSCPVKAKPARVRMKLLRLNEEIDIPVLFVDTEKVDVILGRNGFFDRYVVKFDLKKDMFEIKKPKSAASES